TSASPSTTYTLSLHDALPICCDASGRRSAKRVSSSPIPCERSARSSSAFTSTRASCALCIAVSTRRDSDRAHQRSGEQLVHTSRSEEHTSELQSPYDLVCRLL